VPVQETSREAYYSVVDTALPETENRVLAALQDVGAMCNRDIALLIDQPINCVTPAVFRLRERGLVTERYRDKHPESQRRVIYWGAV